MQASKDKTVIIVAGPTAVGKTAAAIQLALHFKTEIISADSRQCYTELNIGVARPSLAELAQVKHHFIASHTIHDEVNAAVFEQYALQKANELFLTHNTIVMVGGTGLYIKAFCEGLDEIPMIKPGIRAEITSKFSEKGLAWLQQEVKLKDPLFYEAGEIQNPQRMMRALEVVESTGQSVLRFRKGEKAQRTFDIIKTGLELPREQLRHRIDKRVNQMIDLGLIGEVKALSPYRHLNAMQTVGYTEIVDYLDGKLSLAKAIEQIQANTRQYAKRQMTWFRKDNEMKWFDPSDIAGLIENVDTAKK